MKPREQRRAQGQVMVMFALFGMVLIGAMALALDVGYLLSERREAQAAADASALAGARALLGGESSSAVISTARKYAVDNGIASSDSGASNIEVDVEGDKWDGAVTVDVTMQVPRFFLGAIYTGPWEVSAHAVAETSNKADANYILIALDPPGIYVNGSMEITAHNGSIISNSNIESSGELQYRNHGWIHRRCWNRGIREYLASAMGYPRSTSTGTGSFCQL